MKHVAATVFYAICATVDSHDASIVPEEIKAAIIRGKQGGPHQNFHPPGRFCLYLIIDEPQTAWSK
jgi:hypothetical protein